MVRSHKRRHKPRVPVSLPWLNAGERYPSCMPHVVSGCFISAVQVNQTRRVSLCAPRFAERSVFVVLNCYLLPPPYPPLFRRASDLLKVEVLRLDWQRIPSIQNLDIFTHLRELYLQHNRIQVIEELDTLRSLEFLALGSNCIRRLENLRHLSKVSLPNCQPFNCGDGTRQHSTLLATLKLWYRTL